MALTSWALGNYLSLASPVVTTADHPFLVSVWGNSPDVTGAVHYAINIGVDGSDNNCTVDLGTLSGGGQLLSGQGATPGTREHAVSSASPSVNTWFHMSGEMISTTSRAVLLNGSGRGTNTNSVTVTTANSVYIGAGIISPFLWNATGGIAEISIWKCSGMTTGNMDSLAVKLYNGGAAGAGGNPININAETAQPWTGKLAAYWPMTNTSTLTDSSGNGLTLTMIGTLTNFASHPTIEAVSTGGGSASHTIRWRVA
jgi:Concanavalin A-like lectin/glucanases superfamily